MVCSAGHFVFAEFEQVSSVRDAVCTVGDVHRNQREITQS